MFLLHISNSIYIRKFILLRKKIYFYFTSFSYFSWKFTQFLPEFSQLNIKHISNIVLWLMALQTTYPHFLFFTRNSDCLNHYEIYQLQSIKILRNAFNNDDKSMSNFHWYYKTNVCCVIIKVNMDVLCWKSILDSLM
jgi:hypothetical protein